MEVVEKKPGALLVKVNGSTSTISLPIHHLSDFPTIAKNKHALATPGCVFTGIVVNPRTSVGKYCAGAALPPN